MSSGNENPASSRQMRNEKRPRNGCHFASHQLSSTHVAADAYVPMTSAHAPYPNTANTIETEASVSATAGSMMTRRLNWNVRCISASGTLQHECRRIIPEFAAAIRLTRESWNSAPISGEATRFPSASSRPVTKVTTITVLAASSMPCWRWMSAWLRVFWANTAVSPVSTVPAAKMPTSCGPSSRPSTSV